DNDRSLVPGQWYPQVRDKSPPDNSTAAGSTPVLQSCTAFPTGCAKTFSRTDQYRKALFPERLRSALLPLRRPSAGPCPAASPWEYCGIRREPLESRSKYSVWRTLRQ